MRDGVLAEVVVHDAWRRALRPGQLREAVLDAAREAAVDAVTASARASTGQGSATGAPDPTTAAGERLEPARLPAVSPHAPSEQSLAAMSDVLDELTSGLRTMLDRIDAEDAAPDGAAPSPARTMRRMAHVTLTFEGPALVDVALDLAWVAEVDAAALTRELRGALASPSRSDGPAAAATSDDLARLQALAALAQDPPSLAARLRLRD
ncbi:hypothetical protein [Litorihabitans aurantiacus]|uniref:Uncharacterized protein n=1 Tax=Litorihabitans aurantiacus TaxID=1930061 RepID=A0AA37XHQ5_9MICO|nr:hypothetical protein [Litorihabitans aurantiacus]GMA33127.1 hypothetical protein GCM10025875_31190 [Litorihabitans aurantiacus]